MKTKLQLLFVMLFTTFAIGAMAQDDKKAEDAAQKLTDKMTKELSLNQDQVDKIKDINLNYVKKDMELKKQYANDKDEREKQLKENNADREVKARNVFNDKQYNDYLAKKVNFEI